MGWLTRRAGADGSSSGDGLGAATFGVIDGRGAGHIHWNIGSCYAATGRLIVGCDWACASSTGNTSRGADDYNIRGLDGGG